MADTLEEAPEVAAKLKLWDKLRFDVKSLPDALDLAQKYASAFAVLAESAYATNAEIVSGPDEEVADIGMVGRMLAHVEEVAAFIRSDLDDIQRTLGELRAAVTEQATVAA